jgi:hypothetical protein
VDKGVYKPLLTAGIACNDGRYNKLPNPQADFFHIKSMTYKMQKVASRRLFRNLKNILCISAKCDTVVSLHCEFFDKSAGKE